MSDYTLARARPISSAAAIRRISTQDVWAALREGWNDFLAIPTQLVFLCLLYPVIGLVAARAADGMDVLPLLFPLVAGLALLGPVMAVGVYELSRRREQGLDVSARHALDVLRSPHIFGIAMLGLMLLAVFVVWIGVAKLIFTATIGQASPASAGEFLSLLDTTAGWTMMIVGDVVGAGFAGLVLVLTVVSVPMVLDRGVSPLVAIKTSILAALLNPGPILLWGILVGALLALGCVPLFCGLAVAMPVLGHATWHLYRRVVGD
jgi:uncharacterized membrane protein